MHIYNFMMFCETQTYNATIFFFKDISHKYEFASSFDKTI